MRITSKLFLSAAWWAALASTTAFAQEEGPKSATVPNSMDMHTRFIILAVGALLLWCISYTLQAQKEAASRKKGRESLARLKENCWMTSLSCRAERITAASPNRATTKS